MLRRAVKRSAQIQKQAKRRKPLIEDQYLEDSVQTDGDSSDQNDEVDDEQSDVEEKQKVDEKDKSPGILDGDEDLIRNLGRKRQQESLHEKEGLLDRQKKPAWVDEDDEKIQLQDVVDGYKKGKRKVENSVYKKYLDKRFSEVCGSPEWAKIKPENDSTASSDESDEGDDILRRAGDLLVNKSEFLSKGLLQIKQCRNLNYESQAEGSVIRSVEFHPSATVGMVAGKCGVVTLFQVDGKLNPKIQSVKFSKFPIHTAHFSSNGEELVVGSHKHAYFYYYDMIAGKIIQVPAVKDMDQTNMKDFEVSPDGRVIAFQGKYGYIHLLTAKTKEWITSLKMSDFVRSLAFNKDGSKLYSHGDGGEVFVWDMNTRNCVQKFHDDGCIKGTAISLSPDGQLIACGSDSGVVNMYNSDTASQPKLAKILLNLTTPITRLKFNSTNEMMVMTSDWKDNAIRLVHVPSMTVFSNWPQNFNMRRVSSADFSLNSGYLAIANNTGKAYLYRLKHYSSY